MGKPSSVEVLVNVTLNGIQPFEELTLKLATTCENTVTGNPKIRVKTDNFMNRENIF